MLHSEVSWFPRFIRLCQCHMKWWMGEEDIDYEAMQHILRCQVYTFLNGYKETAFTELIQTKLNLAQFLVAGEKGLL